MPIEDKQPSIDVEALKLQVKEAEETEKRQCLAEIQEVLNRYGMSLIATPQIMIEPSTGNIRAGSVITIIKNEPQG